MVNKRVNIVNPNPIKNGQEVPGEIEKWEEKYRAMM